MTTNDKVPGSIHRARPHITLLALALLPGVFAAGCDTEPTKSVFADGGTKLDRSQVGTTPTPDAGAPPSTTPLPGNPPAQTPSSPQTPPQTPAATPAGEALIKFCNVLAGPSGPIELELRVGSISFKARTNQCSPGTAEACTRVPAGRTAVALLGNGAPLWSDTIDIQPGVTVVAETGLDSNGKPLVMAKPVASAAACASAGITPTTPPPQPQQPPQPQPGGTLVPAKFCHDLTKAGQDIDLELVVGNVRLRARSGGCSTAAAQTCSGIPVGSHVATLLDGGNAVATLPVTIAAGEQYFFYPDLEDMRPAIKGGPLKAGIACATVDPFTSTPQ